MHGGQAALPHAHLTAAGAASRRGAPLAALLHSSQPHAPPHMASRTGTPTRRQLKPTLSSSVRWQKSWRGRPAGAAPRSFETGGQPCARRGCNAALTQGRWAAFAQLFTMGCSTYGTSWCGFVLLHPCFRASYLNDVVILLCCPATMRSPSFCSSAPRCARLNGQSGGCLR